MKEQLLHITGFWTLLAFCDILRLFYLGLGCNFKRHRDAWLIISFHLFLIVIWGPCLVVLSFFFWICAQKFWATYKTRYILYILYPVYITGYAVSQLQDPFLTSEHYVQPLTYTDMQNNRGDVDYNKDILENSMMRRLLYILRWVIYLL